MSLSVYTWLSFSVTYLTTSVEGQRFQFHITHVRRVYEERSRAAHMRAPVSYTHLDVYKRQNSLDIFNLTTDTGRESLRTML